MTSENQETALILLIDDEHSVLDFLAGVLREVGYQVALAQSGEEGLRVFAKRKPDLVISDWRMDNMDGLGVLTRIKATDADVPVLIATGYSEVDVAVQAMKAGACDFIGKPINPDHLLLVVAHALEKRRLREEVTLLRARVKSPERPILTRSPVMLKLLTVVERIAKGNATVLITGETGTGKELIARRIHYRSPAQKGPFVAVNCAAIPSELLESELFGHEKGAFTGAIRARRGRFREAKGGTLFLDEVGELPASMQGKLLRVLQEHVVDVIGKDTPEQVDVRLVAATNRNLAELAERGTFRADLLYRLNVVEVHVPPLRERPEDIELLANHFISEFSEGRDLKVPDELLSELRSHRWPGNVRQLQNACERLVLLATGDTLRVEDLPVSRSPPSSGTIQAAAASEWPELPEHGLNLVDLEKRVIERVLLLKAGNISHAAQYLGIPRHVLAYRLSKYGLDRERSA